MATTIAFNRNLARSQDLSHVIKTMEQADYQLDRLVDIMTNLLEGDGTDPTHFTTIVTEFGFESSAKAKPAYELLKAVNDLNNSTGQVTDVRLARRRVISRLR